MNGRWAPIFIASSMIGVTACATGILGRQQREALRISRPDSAENRAHPTGERRTGRITVEVRPIGPGDHQSSKESEVSRGTAMDAEYSEALSILKEDAFFGVSHSGEWLPYLSMPGILQSEALHSDAKDERVVSVGILPEEGSALAHEVVGVSLDRRKVYRFSGGAPLGVMATPQLCGPRSARQQVVPRGTEGRANVVVRRGDEVLWSFLVIRPSVSAGSWGSGIEVQEVHYKGKKVLSRAQTPILSVLYEENACGPFRDWQYSEGAYEARGELIAPGILQAAEPARTIFDTNQDRGSFRGVAIFTEGQETILVSELESGWYRYKSEFRFHEDGSFRPVWGFAGVHSSCTCNPHTHHGYFRLDFDLGDSQKNQAQVLKGTQWIPIHTEMKFRRGGDYSQWRVIDVASGSGYVLMPGAADGQADRYGRGDLWILRFNRGELDDTDVYSGTSANIDAFLNRQSVSVADVVLWYGFHLEHRSDNINASENKELGPVIRPF